MSTYQPETTELNVQLRELTSGKNPDIRAVMNLLDRLEQPSPDVLVKQLLERKAAVRPSALWRGSFDVQTLMYMDRLYDQLS